MHNRLLHTTNLSFIRIAVAALLAFAALPGRVTAQQINAPISPASSAVSSAVPQIIQFSGQLNGQPSGTSGGSGAVPSGTVSITFTLYENEQGGTALWSETDNVQVNAQGNYTAWLGSASPDGLPMNLFTTGQAHWLEVQPLLQGFGEQPRLLLVSVPYALKAGDAETIGGLPPSALLMTDRSKPRITASSSWLLMPAASLALRSSAPRNEASESLSICAQFLPLRADRARCVPVIPGT